MSGKKTGAVAGFAMAFIAGAVVFTFTPSHVQAQDSTQWVPFTVGHFDDQNSSQVTIYTTNGSFVVSNEAGDQPTTEKHNGKEETVTPVFGSSTENGTDDAETWSGSLPAGTYFVGVNGDPNSLSISGEAVNYTQPLPSAPAAPAPVATPVVTPAPVAQPQPSNPTNQTQWYSLTVGPVKNKNTAQVNIEMTDGTFVVSNTPSDQPTTVKENGKDEIKTPVFGSSSENEEGNAQIWQGALIPGTYFVGVNGDTSTLSVWGDAVNFAPLSSSGQ